MLFSVHNSHTYTHTHTHTQIILLLNQLVHQPGQRSPYSDEDTGWITVQPCFDSRQRQKIILFSKAPRPAVGLTLPSTERSLFLLRQSEWKWKCPITLILWQRMNGAVSHFPHLPPLFCTGITLTLSILVLMLCGHTLFYPLSLTG